MATILNLTDESSVSWNLKTKIPIKPNCSPPPYDLFKMKSSTSKKLELQVKCAKVKKCKMASDEDTDLSENEVISLVRKKDKIVKKKKGFISRHSWHFGDNIFKK